MFCEDIYSFVKEEAAMSESHCSMLADLCLCTCVAMASLIASAEWAQPRLLKKPCQVGLARLSYESSRDDWCRARLVQGQDIVRKSFRGTGPVGVHATVTIVVETRLSKVRPKVTAAVGSGDSS